MSELSEKESTDLDLLISRRGPRAVLDAFGDLCNDKAERIRIQLKDVQLAKRWETVAAMVLRVASHIEAPR